MPSREAMCVVDCANSLGESPLWCPRDQVLWWIDVGRPALWRYRPSDRRVENWSLPKPPAAIALHRGGGLVVIFRRGLCVIEQPGAHLAELRPADLGLGEDRFNDAKVDRMGNLWIGSMDRHQRSPIGSLYRIGADRRLQCYASGFTLANGIGWSPDHRRMYFVETGEKRIYQFDFDPEVGEISNRSVLVQLDATAGEPDGLCVDSKGNIWVALFDAGRLNRYRDNGILDRTLPMPVRRPTSCCLGGVALDTLYITSAKIGHSPGEDDSMGAGGLWAVEVECPGRPENEFG